MKWFHVTIKLYQDSKRQINDVYHVPAPTTTTINATK